MKVGNYISWIYPAGLALGIALGEIIHNIALGVAIGALLGILGFIIVRLLRTPKDDEQ